MTTERFRLRYPASIFWLIFWLIVFFPFAIVSLLCNLKVASGKRTYRLRYSGARFWLYFWALFFFPLVILLFLLNGSFEKKSV